MRTCRPILAIIALLVSTNTTLSETVLDVLVLYTSKTRAYHGGTDGTLAHIQAAFVQANEAFENSEVSIRLRARAIEHIDYSDHPTDMGEDLDYITESSEVLALRNETGADLVSLFRRDSAGETAGIAWLLRNPNGDETAAYSVVSSKAVASSTTFHHEIGHNLGAAHDRENSENGGLYPYSHGHRFQPDNRVQQRTIMAYSPGWPTNHFSNPNVQFAGTPTGIASGEDAADNARGFNLIAHTIDAYREHIHRLPIADAGDDIVSEDFNGNGSETVTLDGSASSAQDSIVSWEWNWQGGSSSGVSISADFPLGETIVTLTVTDSKGYDAEDTVIVTIIEGYPVRSFQAGLNHSIFIKHDGTLLGAGNKGEGLLGFFYNGDNQFQTTPIDVPLDDVVSVSSGSRHNLFLKSDGSVWGTGRNSSGSLGNASSYAYQPYRIVDRDVVKVSAGGSHSLFLKTDGSVWGVGSNWDHQLGLDTNRDTRTPTKIIESDVIDIEAGGGSSYFVKSDGSLWMTGFATYSLTIETPREIVPSNVVSVSSSGDHALLIKTDGSLWAFGQNQYGQLGIGNRTESEIPKMVLSSGVAAIAAGNRFSLILKQDGSLWITGQEFYYSEGSGGEPKTLSPKILVPENVTSVVAFSGHAFFNTTDGSTWAIGNNNYGQLANGNTEYQTEPIKIFSSSVIIEDSPPNAVSGGNIFILDDDVDGKAFATLDGSGSGDDWWIKNYRWTWNGNSILGRSLNVEFERGQTEVEFTVTDDQGLTDTDTFIVTVADPSDYRQTRIFSESGVEFLEVMEYSTELEYTLWQSYDLINWQIIDSRTQVVDNSLIFELENAAPRFYRIELSTSQ